VIATVTVMLAQRRVTKRRINGLAALLVVQYAAAVTAGGLSVELGDIPQRPVPPVFPFERFVQTRELAQLQFAPDKRKVYYLAGDGHVDNLFVMRLDTGATRQVTRFDEAVSAFMPDHQGRFVILVMDVGGNENDDLYRFDLDTGKRVRLTDAGRGDSTLLCGLSPDDSKVYYAQTLDNRREADIRVVNSDGTGARVLLPGRGRTLECDAVSEDGRYLLYAGLKGFDTRDLGLLDLDTGSTQSIVAVDGINNLDGGFCGRTVYFRSALGADGFRLWRYRIGEDAPVPVRLPFDNDIDSLSLHAGGRVAVIGYRDRLSERTAVFIDGFEQPADTGVEPDALVGAVFSRDDPAIGIVSTETAAQPRRYYRLGAQGPALLYDSNRSGIDTVEFAEVRSLLIPSFDGLRIPVHLYIPNGTSAKRPRPALLFIHGGPDEHLDPRYNSTFQFLANRGYVVVVPNVRGSTGFGRQYAALDDGDWGGAHVRDTLAVAQAVRRFDFVQGNNLFVAGASFGGFSVMSLLTRYPPVFNAAVDFFGFTELASFVASWPRYLQRHLATAMGFDPRRDRYRNWLMSPIYHLENIRTPLQIHQGANDSRVPREQSDWLVQRLRELGLEVEYFVYPDEGHGFTRLANERDAYLRLVAFFDSYRRPAVAGRSALTRHKDRLSPGLIR